MHHFHNKERVPRTVAFILPLLYPFVPFPLILPLLSAYNGGRRRVLYAHSGKMGVDLSQVDLAILSHGTAKYRRRPYAVYL